MKFLHQDEASKIAMRCVQRKSHALHYVDRNLFQNTCDEFDDHAPMYKRPAKKEKTKDLLFYYVSENVTTRVFLFPENLKYRKLKKNLINHVVSNSD